jgi:hypothetical protein
MTIASIQDCSHCEQHAPCRHTGARWLCNHCWNQLILKRP